MNFNNGEEKEGFAAPVEEGSIFSIFQEKPAPAAAPPPPPARTAAAGPAAPPSPAQLNPVPLKPEAVERSGGQPRPESGITDFLQKKITELEKRLYETQERALAFSLELKGKEELQRQNMRQVEDMFNSLRNNKRAEESDKALRDKLERLGQVSAGLEARLAEAGAARKTAEDGAKAAEIANARLADRFGAVEERIKALQERLSTGFDGRFSAIDEKLGEARAGAGAAAENLKELRSKMEQAEARLGEAGEAHKGAENRQSGFIDAMKSLGERLETLETRVSGLAAVAAGTARSFPETVEKLNNRMAEVEAAAGLSEDLKQAYDKRLNGLESSLRDPVASPALSLKALAEMRESVGKLREKLAGLEAGGGVYGDSMKDVALRLSAVEGRLARSAADPAGLVSICEELRVKAASLESRMAAAEKQAGAGGEFILASRETAKNVESRLAWLQAGVAEPGEKVRDLERRFELLAERAAHAQSLAASATSDVKEARERTEDLEARLVDITAQDTAAAGRLEYCGTRIAKLETLIGEMVAREAVPREKLNGVAARTAALEESLASVEGLKLDFRTLREDTARGSAAAAETRGFAAKLAVFEAAVAGLEKRLTGQDVNHNTVTGEFAVFENKLQYLTVILNSLRETVGRLSGPPPPPRGRG